MTRDELEQRAIEILARGGEPMDDPEIRRAVSEDAEHGKALDDLRSFVLRLNEVEPPDWDARNNIDYMIRAFEEGFRQGRAFAAQRAAAPAWLTPIRRFAWVAATVVIAVGAVYLWQRTAHADEIADLRADMQGLQETVAVSLLESQSASQRLRGLQWSRTVHDPGDRLLGELSQTLRRDENVDVRLAAADVMSHYTDRPQVRRALYESVLNDAHPMVQVQVIDVFTVARDDRAARVLRELLEKPEVSDVVRVRANEALTELGSFNGTTPREGEHEIKAR